MSTISNFGWRSDPIHPGTIVFSIKDGQNGAHKGQRGSHEGQHGAAPC